MTAKALKAKQSIGDVKPATMTQGLLPRLRPRPVQEGAVLCHLYENCLKGINRMKHSSSRSFYIGILKEEKKFVHGVGNTPEFLLKGMGVSVDDEKTEDPPKEEEEEDESVFGTVFRDFISKMESYRQFISLTLFFAPFLSIAIAERK